MAREYVPPGPLDWLLAAFLVTLLLIIAWRAYRVGKSDALLSGKELRRSCRGHVIFVVGIAVISSMFTLLKEVILDHPFFWDDLQTSGWFFMGLIYTLPILVLGGPIFLIVYVLTYAVNLRKTREGKP